MCLCMSVCTGVCVCECVCACACVWWDGVGRRGEPERFVCVWTMGWWRGRLKDKLNRTLFFIAIVTQPIPGFKVRSLSIMPPIHFSREMPSVGGTYFWAAQMLRVWFWCSCCLACLLLVLSQVAGNKGRAKAFAVIQFTLFVHVLPIFSAFCKHPSSP